MRLFVAISLPEEVRRALASKRPAETEGLTRVRAELLHLTLQFIGEAERETIAEALGRVAMPGKITVKISGAGVFGRLRERMVFWAGVDPSDGLLRLQASVAACLKEAGFTGDARPYRPHITLARGSLPKGREKREERLALRRALRAFLEKHRALELPEFEVSDFGLFASEQSAGQRHHRRLQSFPSFRR